jgi:hypothetical protein
MKKLITLALLLPFSILAQDLPDITKTVGKSDNQERFMIQLTFDNWLDAPDSIEIGAGSRGFNLYTMFDLTLTNNLSFAPGIGIGVSNIQHDAFFTEDSARNTVLVPIPSGIDYKKNKVTTAFLDIPVELRFRSNPNAKKKTFNVAVGFKAGYLINSHTKYKGDDLFPGSTDKVKVKSHDLRNVLKYRYGVTGRIGYGGTNLLVYYGLSEFFEDGQGPAVTPFSIGFSFNML